MPNRVLWLFLLSILCLTLTSCLSDFAPNDKQPSFDDTSAPTERRLRLEGRQYFYNGNADDITVSDDVLTICAAGDYHVSGALTEGSLAVSVAQSDTVRLILDGVSITSSYHAPFSVLSAACVILELSSDTVSTLTDAPRTQSEPNALLPVACAEINSHLLICGEGTLILRGRQHTALASSESITVESGKISLSASEFGIWARDRFSLTGGSLTVTAAPYGIVTDTGSGTVGEIRILGGNLVASCSKIALCAGKRIAVENGSGSLQAPLLYQCRYQKDSQTVEGEIVISAPDFPHDSITTKEAASAMEAASLVAEFFMKHHAFSSVFDSDKASPRTWQNRFSSV